MALYFFDTSDGETALRDDVGLEFATDAAAFDAAALGLADLSRELILGYQGRTDTVSISVRNAAGARLQQMTVSFSIDLPA